MTRYILYGIVGITVALALAYGMAVQYGLDPLDSRLTLYWVVVLLVGVYLTVRVAMILETRRKRRERLEGDTRPSGASLRSARRKAGPQSSLDARMEARRERVRKAKEKAEAEGKTAGETPD